MNLIDLNENKAYVILETRDMPLDSLPFKKLCVSTTEDGRIRILFVTIDKEMKNTIVEEIILGRYFI